MTNPAFVLRTKLLPPRTVPEVLHRDRLFEKLRANQASPITIAAADAGCGKTTLIAEFVKAGSRPAVWYQLDNADADPVVFLSYLTAGIANIKPGFGVKMFGYLAEAGDELARFPERAVDLLINEVLDQFEEPFIIVLDDYHHIGRETPVHKLVDRLVQYSADLFHLMITTRDLPPLAIAKRKAQFRSMMITRADLLFTDDEVRQLFKTTLNLDLSDPELEQYRKRTQGWITALQLIRQVAERELSSGADEPLSALKDVLKSSELDIFDYFAEEVISRESPEIDEAIVRLSIIDPMPVAVCQGLFPEVQSSVLLPELAQRNVFISVAGDADHSETYRFHPLFRDFLLRRFRSEKGNAAVASEQARIASLFLSNGSWEKALPLLIEAGETETAARILAEHGSKWIATGAFRSVSRVAGSIPNDKLERSPHALLHIAEAERSQGHLENARRALERAVNALSKSNDREGQAEALHSLASIARRKGEMRSANELLDRAESFAAPDSDTLMKCANTRGLCYVTEGKWAAAEQRFRFALDIAERNGNDAFVRVVAHNLALAPGFRGDFAEALRWFRRIFAEGDTNKQLPQEAIGHLNIARLHLYRGEFSETEKHLGLSLQLCGLFDLRALRGEIYESFANMYRERNELSRAKEFYNRSERAYSEALIDPVTKEFYEEFARYHRLAGDGARARQILEKLVEYRKEKNDEHGIRTAELLICRLDLDERRMKGIADRIEKYADFFKERGNYFDEALATMMLAEANSLLDKPKQVSAAINRVLDLSARFDYEYWLRNEIERNRDLFSNDDVAARLPLDLRELVRGSDEAVSVEAPAPLLETKPQTEERFADLKIELLGHVKIFRNSDRPLTSDVWTTKRARDIFCYIASSKDRRVAKDVLIDQFWPNDDLAAIEKNFHPTISHIRKALNLGRTVKQNLLIFRDGCYQFNSDAEVWIDTEEFESLISAAEKAKREKANDELRYVLERASELYRGEFMEGTYDDWAEERRGYFREQNIRVCSALAKLAFAEKRWSSVQQIAEQIISDDPFREDIHRLLMRTFAAQGKPAAVKKHFEELQRSLQTELGIGPSAETRRIYSELIG